MTGADDVPRYYFAYGSNLSARDWGRWRRERNLPERLIRARVPAWLPDHELRFHYFSRSRGGGALDVAPRRGCLVPGLLFRVQRRGLRALDRKEGAPNYYERVHVDVIAEVPGRPPRLVRALTYRVRPERRLDRHVPPTEDYVEVVREGYRKRRLGDTAMLDAAARGGPMPPPLGRVAVYGTLRRGGGNHRLLADLGARLVGTGRLPGTLLDLGAFPMLPLGGTGDGAVVEVWELPDPEAGLARLDALEGCPGFAAPARFYARVPVSVALDEGGATRAWTWVLPERFDSVAPAAEPVETATRRLRAPAVPGGDWMAPRA